MTVAVWSRIETVTQFITGFSRSACSKQALNTAGGSHVGKSEQEGGHIGDELSRRNRQRFSILSNVSEHTKTASNNWKSIGALDYGPVHFFHAGK